MEIVLKRKEFFASRTMGELWINGEKFSDVLEDRDRGLHQFMELEEIKLKKVWGQTAIPYGKYVLVLSYSNKFKRLLPELLSVPGFSGIRIHSGNVPEDTHGCLLVGRRVEDKILESKIAEKRLLSLLSKVNKSEKITIQVEC